LIRHIFSQAMTFLLPVLNVADQIQQVKMIRPEKEGR